MSSKNANILSEASNLSDTEIETLVQTQTEELWHWKIAWLAALSMKKGVCDPTIILPQV